MNARVKFSVRNSWDDCRWIAQRLQDIINGREESLLPHGEGWDLGSGYKLQPAPERHKYYLHSRNDTTGQLLNVFVILDWQHPDIFKLETSP